MSGETVTWAPTDDSPYRCACVWTRGRHLAPFSPTIMRLLVLLSST